MLIVLFSLCALAFAVIVYIATDRHRQAEIVIAKAVAVEAKAEALDAKASRESIVHDMRILRTVVQTLAVHSATDPSLRQHLVAGLHESHALCDHCPLLDTAICADCGRYVSARVKAP